MLEYGVVENPTGSDKLRHPERTMGPMTEEQADHWTLNKSGNYLKVVRSVSEWYIPLPPVDFSVSQEEADEMDHLVMQSDKGYKLHAFKLTEGIRKTLVEQGLGKYYGVYRASGEYLIPFCKNLKRMDYSRQGIPERGDITHMENTKRVGFDGVYNTVCTDCQREVRAMRMDHG